MADFFKREYSGSMDSKYYFTSDKIPAGKIGATASMQTPNQIGELTSRLNQGLKAVEIGAMNQRLLDQVPLKHFTEMKRLNKLTGAEASLHAPIQDLDLAGFTEHGWNEYERKGSVEKLKSVIDRAHALDEKGNIPITVHAGGFPSQKWQKEGLYKGGEIEETSKPLQDQRSEMAIVNQDTGQMQQVRYREKEYISGKKMAWTPEFSMNNLNRVSWDEEQLRLMQHKKEMNEVIDRFTRSEGRYLELLEANKKKILTEREKMELASLESEKERVADHQKEIYQNMRSLVEDMYNRYKKYKPEVATLEAQEREKEIERNMGVVKSQQQKMEIVEQELDKLEVKFKKSKEEEAENIRLDYMRKANELNKTYHEQTESIVRTVSKMPAPKTWVPIDKFAKEKVSSSITEAALYAYKKYGEKAPIISVENVYPEFALSRANSLKETVELAKENFAKELQSKEKLSRKKAEEIANKIIGITWDVGHIYMLKKYGYTDEDIRKEAEKVGKHVSHIHLTDNFGFEDSHLPPGEGAVNIKEQLEEIEKSLTEEQRAKMKAIVEAGEFVANFKEVPHLYALSHLNSPLYPSRLEDGTMMPQGPYWKEIWDSYGTYFGGFGEIMPQKYFDLYGAPGFSQLPSSLGGSSATPERGRFASTSEEA